jgi:hypothetical protein
MSILAPAADAAQPPNGPVLQWRQLNGARSYSVSISPTGGPGTSVSNVTTVASAYAPLVTFATGAYQWTVTAKDAGGNVIGSAQSTFTVNAQLAALQAPQIQAPGGTGVGQTLTSTPPGWDQPDVANSYQWLRNGSRISGATGTTYTLTLDDFGKSISLQVTGRKPGYSDGVSVSNALDPTAGYGMAATTPPSITGNAAVGSVLTGDKGVWSGSPTSYTYQWLRDDREIEGATGTTYRPVAADVGTMISLRVKAVRNGYQDAVAVSSAVSVSSLAASAPVTIAAPTGSGVGETLISAAPVWNQPDVANSYQWQRDGTRISGATGPTYALTTLDLGKAITLQVTGRKTGFIDAVSTSNAVVGTAGGALQPTTQPTITGSAVSGSTVRVSPGTWSQASPSFAYQWLRTGAPIPGATSSSYRITPQDAGTSIAVLVLATKAGYHDGAATSVAVTVPQLTSTTTAALSASRVKKGQRVKIGITVAVPGVTGPLGTVKVYDGAKVIKTLPLVSAREGKVTWKMKKLKPGKHKIKAVFLGNATTSGSKSKVTKLVVVRR